jgi:hypothetical protein
MALRFTSLQRRRGLLFNLAVILFLAFFAVAAFFSIGCKFQTPCTPSYVIDDGWLNLLGQRSSSENGSSTLDNHRASAAIEEEDDVVGPAYCPVCGSEDALCAKYGYVIVHRASSGQARSNPVGRSHNLARSIAYEGSAARLRRVMENAAQGRPTRIGVLGVWI